MASPRVAPSAPPVPATCQHPAGSRRGAGRVWALAAAAVVACLGVGGPEWALQQLGRHRGWPQAFAFRRSVNPRNLREYQEVLDKGEEVEGVSMTERRRQFLVKNMHKEYVKELIKLGKRRRWLDALACFRDMQERALDAGWREYKAVITAAGKARQWQLSMDLFEQMKAKNRDFQPGMSQYATMLNIMGRSKAWQAVLMCVQDMREQLVDLDENGYSLVLNVCGRAALWELALYLLYEMPDASVEQDSRHFIGALDACENAGEDEWFEKVWDDGEYEGVELA